jgi:hypothetical protein
MAGLARGRRSRDVSALTPTPASASHPPEEYIMYVGLGTLLLIIILIIIFA